MPASSSSSFSMLKFQQYTTLTLISSPFQPFFSKTASFQTLHSNLFFHTRVSWPQHCQKLLYRGGCSARRRIIRYDEEDDDDDEYGQNSEIVMLESYAEAIRNEVLLVRAMVDDQEEEVLIFKGFSSCLSYRTSPDPSRSVLPARAVITSIDRVKGPFDPSNIEYIEKSIKWEDFKTRLQSNTI